MKKYSIVYEKDDHGLGEIRNEVFYAPNDKAALLIAGPWFSYGCCRFDPDNFTDEEKEEIKGWTVEELGERIAETNGDGDNMLFSLRNETDGITLFENGYGMEDDTDGDVWEEDMFEGFLSEND